MSQFAMGAMLAGRAAIALGTQPVSSPEYFLTMAEGGSIAVSFSRVMSLEVTAEGKVMAASIEKGSFASYNKVAKPMEIKAQLAVEGTRASLQSTINTIINLKEGTDLVNFVTPFHEYRNFTLEKFSYQQSAENGINVLYVDIALSEVREVEPQYTDTKPITPKAAKNPANASTRDLGKGQAKKDVPESKYFQWRGTVVPDNSWM